MKVFNKYLNACITVFLIGLFFVWCSPVLGQGARPNIQAVKIGAIIPLTGPISFVGELIKEGLELAIEEVNPKIMNDGYQLEIVYGDNQGSTAKSVSLIQKDIHINKIKFFMVSPTPSSMAVAPIVDKAKRIMFAGSTHPYITDLSQYIFRTCASNAEENELLIKYAEKKGIKSVGALFVDDDFGQSAINYFHNHFKGKVVVKEAYNMKHTDFRNQILKLKQSAPDAILIEGYGIAFPIILKQMVELGIKCPILGNLGFVNPPVQKTLKFLPEDFKNNIIFSSPTFSKYFTELIENKFSRKPNLNQAFAYDFIMLIASEISKYGLDVEKIKEAVPMIKNYTGAFENITFLPNGDSRSIVKLMKISNGEIIPYE